MVAAISAGGAADIVCNPLFVVRTRMQTEALHLMEQHRNSVSLSEIRKQPKTILQTIQSLYAEGGVLVFWKGISASLFGLTHVAIQFPVYEFLKDEARQRSKTGHESPMDLLFASGLSKMTASLLTYPHEVIRSRLMDTRSSTHAFKILALVVREEGFSKLYRGLHVSLIRVIPNTCITFLTYEMLLRWSKEQLKNYDLR